MFDERAELLDIYKATPVILNALLRGVPWDRLSRRSAPGEWAGNEVVAHLGDAEERALERVRLLAREDRPQLAAYDPAALAEERGYANLPLADSLARFARLRAAHVAELAALDPAGWERDGLHEEVGRITVQALTAHMAAHDAVHLAQIARLLDGGDDRG